MELNEAIEILESIRNSIWVSFGDCRNKKILSEEEQESIDIILTELGRLSQENKELKQKINDFAEEMRCME